ncbi:hypothetical protein DSO57_1039821 [Entomophthora muscae]|uniref:Uncharacterized protein n=1 Tax=Entomophthora muscae TaxID=34485 RepID=A0ACC2ST17_9FUNG|nr:hypothetical protein DSO57_1039821 [Entomophthora muscae]
MSTHNRRQSKPNINPFTSRPHTVFGSHSLGSIFGKSSSPDINSRLEDLPEEAEHSYFRKNSSSSSKTIDVIRPKDRSFSSGQSSLACSLASNNQSLDSLASGVSAVEEEFTNNNNEPVSSSSASSILKEGYLNKKIDLAPGTVSNTLTRGWKLYYVTLKGAKLSFYKPPSEAEIRNSIAFSFNNIGINSPISSSPSGPMLSSGLRSPASSGMALIPATFDSAARSLLFEPPSSEEHPLSEKYLYGDMFTEVDVLHFKFKRFVCLLIFENDILVFKRRWVRNNRTSLFGAVNGALRMGQGNNQTQDMDPSKGYFSKWKHHASYRLNACEVMNASSTLFNKKTSGQVHVFSQTNSSASSIATLTPQSDYSAPLASGKVQAFQLFINDKEKTTRLFVAPTAESKLAWTSRLAYAKEPSSFQGPQESTASEEKTLEVVTSHLKGEVDSISSENATTPADTNKPRLFWGLGQHPELLLHPNFDSEDAEERSIVKGGTVNALVHEAIFMVRTSRHDCHFRETFLYSYPLFTSSAFILHELKRYASLFPEAESSPEQLAMKIKAAEFVAAWLSISGPNIESYLLAEIRGLVMEHFGHVKLRVNLTAILEKTEKTRAQLDLLSQEVSSAAISPSTSDGEGCTPSTLLKTGLTPSVFLKMDPMEFAQQLYAFHFVQFGQYQQKLGDPCQMLGSLAEEVHLFSCTPTCPHFLTRLVFHHLFFATPSSAPSRRAGILNQWIQVGHMARDLGDMASWIAIAQAVCSPVVIRLSETWRSVDKRLIRLITKRWVPVLVDTALFSPEHPGRPNPPRCMVLLQEPSAKRSSTTFVIPFFGAFRQYISRLLASQSADIKDGVIPFEMYWEAFQASYALKAQWPYTLTPEAYRHASCPFPTKKLYRDYFLHIASPHPKDQSSFVDEMTFDCSPESLHRRSEICETFFVDDYVSQSGHGSSSSVSLSFPQPVKTSPLFIDLVSSHLPLGNPATAAAHSPNPINSPATSGGVSSDNYFRKRTQSAPVSAYASIIASRDAARKATPQAAPRSPTGLQQQLVLVKGRSLVFFQLSEAEGLTSSGNQAIWVQVCSGEIADLVEVLIYGIKPFLQQMTDHQGNYIRDAGHKLSFNREEYMDIFFCTYRSICRPHALFDLLKESFNRALSRILQDNHPQSDVPRSSDAEQHQILEIFQFWLSYHFHDFVDNPHVGQVLFAFLFSLSQKMGSILSESVRRVARDLYMLSEQRALTPVVSPSGNRSNAERTEPVFRSPYAHLSSPVGSSENLLVEGVQVASWEITQYSELQLLDAFHHFVVPMLRKATVKDYLLSCALLEAQSISTWSWLSSTKPLSYTEDETIVSDMFSLLENCRRRATLLNSTVSLTPGSVACDRVLISLLPRPIADLWQFRDKIRTWAIHQVTGELELEERVRRILKILRMIVICRRQMSALAPLHCRRLADIMRLPEEPTPPLQSTHPVPSFVERGLISGIISPESRCFTRAWNEIASSLNVGPDDLGAILDAIELQFEPNLPPLETVAPCVGWVFESVAALIRDIPDHSNGAINFSKRVGLYKLLQTFSEWVAIATAAQINRRGFDTMKLLSGLEFLRKPDWVRVRHIATNENGNGPTHYASSIYYYATGSGPSRKVFGYLVLDQLEKQKQENKERDRLLREARSQQLDMLKKQQEQAKRHDKQQREQQQRRAKTKELAKVASLFRAVQGPGDSMLSLSQLASIATRKPVHTIKLINASAQEEPTYTKREFVLRIITEEGGQFLLQCPDASDMVQWASLINRAARQAAARRVTLLAQDVRGIQSNEDEIPSIVTSKHRNSIFGVDLDRVMQDGEIPIVARKCIAEVERRGIEEVGIYRVPGSASKISSLCRAFDQDSESVDLCSEEWQDINVVACTLKQFLRDLPEPIATYSLYDSFIQAVGIDDYDERLFAIKDTLPRLPDNNYRFLKILIEHLEKVTDYEEVNHMYATNLAIVFGPTIFRPPPSNSSFVVSMANLGLQQNLVKHLILQYHWLFDVEAEVTREDEEVESVDLAGDISTSPTEYVPLTPDAILP